eukprot:CAMPEP_0117589714 /NCGR_PEP_ID=MMETSP0784-20121206/70565_1 /TAXON_ID=39447 /ORGANISM="" /LENGTH=43 /DNA_ID= /DNA_START= /DNA_END= /DNA_ORIENTATION=
MAASPCEIDADMLGETLGRNDEVLTLCACVQNSCACVWRFCRA